MESHSPPRRAERAGKQSPTATNAYCLRIHSESSPVAVRFYGNILSQFESKTTPTEKEWVEQARAAHAEQEYAKALACYEQALGVCLEAHFTLNARLTDCRHKRSSPGNRGLKQGVNKV